MKKNKTSLLGIVMGMTMLLAGVQGVFAQNCLGTLHVQVPSNWGGDINIYYGDSENKVVATLNEETGFYDVNLASVKGNNVATFVIYTTKDGYTNIDYPGLWGISGSVYDNVISGRPAAGDIPCPGKNSEIYVSKDPVTDKVAITTERPGTRYLYVLVPEEKEWQSDNLIAKYTNAKGVETTTAMLPASEYCGWVYAIFPDPPSDLILYRKNDPTKQLGVNGLREETDAATPINLKNLFNIPGVADKLFFIPDEGAWPDEENEGWYSTPKDANGEVIEGTCSFNLAAVIYDTDESLNSLFSTDGQASNCIGVKKGIVKEDLDPVTKKPVFNAGNANATACIGSEAAFSTLFNYTPGVNEVQCYDMPFRHYGKDTRWGYDSDSARTLDNSGRIVLVGGFSPIENTDDAGVVTLNGVLAGPTPAARKKRFAAGPVPNDAEGVLGMALDYYCKTPGWPSGADCEGKFASGVEAITGAIWCWGNYCGKDVGVADFHRWGCAVVDPSGTTCNEGADDGAGAYWDTLKVDVDGKKVKLGGTRNEKRNQQFCFESHATFTYNEDQEFTFRGDDDIWVFINNKIAVDNGGTHLAAPGHVVLKNLNTTYKNADGSPFLVPGQDYPLDIFFCDRRTTMSNVIIKTNMYIKQSTGLDLTPPGEDNNNTLGICVETSGGNDCASVAMGNAGNTSGTTRVCNDQADFNVDVSYVIMTRAGDTVSVLTNGAGPGVNHGIDLTNPSRPVLDLTKITGVPPGSYRLYVIINGKKEYLNFRVKGNLGVVSENVKFVNTDKDETLKQMDGKEWTFVGDGVSSVRVPVYISAPDGQGGIDLASAKNQNYTATFSAGQVFDSLDPEAPVYVGTYTGTINATGVDTLWVTIPLAGLTADPTPITVTVGKTSATINFYAPQIGFATQDAADTTKWNFVSGDPNKDEDGEEYFHWVGADVDLNVVVMNPVTKAICTECNFAIALIASDSLIVGQTYDFVEGVSMVRIRSALEYGTGNEASITVAAVDNNGVQATYGNMHFYKPPVPIPLYVDVFDVYGKPLAGLNLIEPYYKESQEYLDGKADSIAVRYDRALKPDSLPTFICLKFDEDNLKKINPYEMGISNDQRKTEMQCSAEITGAAVKAAYEKAAAATTDSVRVLGFRADSTFSVKVKTSVGRDDILSSFAEYKWRGKETKAAFDKGLTDRMAPVIVKGIIVPQSEDSDNIIDVMTLTFSEPVNFAETFGTEAFSVYLNSATEISSPDARYRNPTAQKAPNQAKEEVSILFRNDEVANPTPHVGDYIRFRADVWSDTVVIDMDAADTVRTDHTTKWNSPTDYNSTGRLPSPWVVLEGAAAITVTEINFGKPDVTNPDKIAAPAVEVFGIPTTASKEDVLTAYPNTLGHILKSDMGALKLSSDQYKNVDPKDIYFSYEVYYFTNLGNYVASKKGKIQCTDETLFAGDCTKSENRKNFYIAWNMKTDKGRFVGSGAYIVKMNSFVKLGEFGKKAKFDETSVWGVKR